MSTFEANDLAAVSDFSLRVQVLRKQRGLNQEELADRAGLHSRTVSNIERGVTTSPGRSTAIRIARALGLDSVEAAALLQLVPKRTHRRDGPPPVRGADTELQPSGFGPIHAEAALPEPVGELIGRESDLSVATATLLGPGRLFMLTGPPGVGKTRLAVELARHPAVVSTVAAVGFVSLATARTASEALGLITRTLGIAVPAPVETVVVLRDYLARGRMLLVLDNLEQIADADELVHTILRSARSARLLTTSRHATGLLAAREIQVGPLALPGPETSPTLAAMRDVPSIRLLVQRAQLARPGFQLTQTSLATIVRICQLLDGLPLALGIAGARLRSLTPAQLLDQLQRQLPVADAQVGDAANRHRTLASAIGWSVSLLDPPTRTAMIRLGAFVGGFTEGAARQVITLAGQDPTVDPDEVVPLLSTLIDKNLLGFQLDASAAPDTPEPEPRYTMLETVREHARTALEASPDAAAVGRAHAAWYRQLAEQTGPALAGVNAAATLRMFDRELGNLRRALDVCAVQGQLGADRSTEDGLVISAELWSYWRARGLLAEGLRHMRRALAVADVATSTRQGRQYATALTTLGVLSMDLGESAEATLAYSRALEIYARIGFHRGVADTLNNLGLVALFQGDYVRADRYQTEAFQLRLAEDDHRRLILSYQNRGDIALDLGDPGTAMSFHTEGLAIAEHLGETSAIAYDRVALAEVATDQRRFAEARRHLSQARIVFAATDDQFGLGFLTHGEGWLEAAIGRHRRAVACQRRAVDHWRRCDNRRGLVLATEAIALSLIPLGHLEAAAQLLDGTRRIAAAGRIGRPPKRTPIVEAAGVDLAALGHPVRPLTPDQDEPGYDDLLRTIGALEPGVVRRPRRVLRSRGIRPPRSRAPGSQDAA